MNAAISADDQKKIDELMKKAGDLDKRFTYHAPKNDQSSRCEEIRKKAKDFAELLDELGVPDSREKSLALTNLEQAVFWATAAIARNE